MYHLPSFSSTSPSDPGAEAEGRVQARFKTYVKRITVDHPVKHYFGHGSQHRKQSGKLQLDSPWVYLSTQIILAPFPAKIKL